MTCSECSACHKVTYNRRTRNGAVQIEKYECWGVREPFEIMDINKECTEYPEKREAKAERKCELHNGNTSLSRNEYSRAA